MSQVILAIHPAVNDSMADHLIDLADQFNVMLVCATGEHELSAEGKAKDVLAFLGAILVAFPDTAFTLKEVCRG